MNRFQQSSIDVLEAILAQLVGAYDGLGVPREEIRAVLERRLAALGGAPAARPFDPARPADGAEVYVEIPAGGGDDAGAL